MAISSPGIGSNLDVNGIVKQLMAVEQRPLQLLNNKEASFQARLSATGSLKGALSGLQSSLSALLRNSTFSGTTKATAGDASVMSASASSRAISGNYQIDVTQLAQAQKLKTTAFASANSVVGSGKLTIQFGTDNGGSFTANGSRGIKTIDIDPSKTTLVELRDALNSAGAGIAAAIVNDGTGYRLAISSNFSGTDNTLKITVEDGDGNNTDASGLSQLAFDPSSGAKQLSESQAAKNALLSIDGISVVKSSNIVSDAIDGVSLTLLKLGSSSLSVAPDRSGIKTAVEGFVKAYNDTNATLRELGGFNPETKVAGPLQGDPALRAAQSQLRAIIGGSIRYTSGTLTNLSQLGISFQRDGSLQLDGSKLQAAIDREPNGVAALFASPAIASDSFVRVTSTPKFAPPGRFPVSVSQIATQATASFSLASTTISTGVNDSFSITVDGKVAAVTIPAGNYSPSSLGAELQSRINGLSAFSSSSSKLSITATGVGGALVGSAGAALTIDDSNRILRVTLNGTTRNIALTAGAYTTASDLATEITSRINAQFGAGAASVTADVGGVLTFSSNGTGPSSGISVAGTSAESLVGSSPGNTAGSAATAAGIAGTTLAPSTLIDSSNDVLDVTIDGVTQQILLTSGTYSASDLQAELQTQIDTAFGPAVATVGESGGQLSISSGTVGAGSNVSVADAAATASASTLFGSSTLTGSGNDANSGQLSGAAAPTLAITASNNAYRVSVDGVTQVLSLAEGTYADASALATEVQTKLTAAFGGAVATVDGSSGSLVFTAASTGAASSINVEGLDVSSLIGAAPTSSGGTGALTFTTSTWGSKGGVSTISSPIASGAATYTAGFDTKGTIGGFDGVGTGQSLSVENGFTIEVTGGTVGDRGQITFDRGMISQLDELLTSLTSSAGSISGKTKGIQSGIEQLNDQREVLIRRLTATEARYRKQFSALDTLMSGLLSTSNYLQTQLANLPKLNGN